MSDHKCICQTDDRLLALVIKNPDQTWPGCDTFKAGDDWTYNPTLKLAIAKVGSGSHWKSLEYLIDFIQTDAGQASLTEIRAAWLRPLEPVEDQMDVILHAEALLEFAPEMNSPLNNMLSENRITTWFQPIFDRNLKIWGYECLMRGLDENGNTVYPKDILEWADRESLNFRLDRICRETHIKNAANFISDPDIHITINFMPTAIYQPRFCLKTTFRAIENTDMSPNQIVFEVVESERVQDIDKLKKTLNTYRDQGFKVALDDIGAGHSGLLMMAELTPDLLKIDRQLIINAAESSTHKSICQSLINMGKEMGKLTLAEGVETPEQADLMREMGVDLYQGYLFGKPAPEPIPESQHHWVQV